MSNLKNVQPLEDFNWEEFENGGISNVSKEAQEESYNATLNKVSEGQVAEGTVISIDKKEVIQDQVLEKASLVISFLVCIKQLPDMGNAYSRGLVRILFGSIACKDESCIAVFIYLEEIYSSRFLRIGGRLGKIPYGFRCDLGTFRGNDLLSLCIIERKTDLCYGLKSRQALEQYLICDHYLLRS